MTSLKNFWSRYRAPFVLFLIVLFCAIAFRQVLLPFMVALFVAYLIDPVVAWASERYVFGKRVPRGAAVLGVYAVVLSLLTLFLVTVGPQLGREVGTLARDAPRLVQELRETHLVRLSEALDRFIVQSPLTEVSVMNASDILVGALDEAEETAFALALLPENDELVRALERGPHVLRVEDARVQRDEPVLRFYAEEDGAWAVSLSENDLWLEPTAEGAWRVRATPSDRRQAARHTPFNLADALDESLARIGETSVAKFSEVLAFGQRLLSTLSAALLATFVTFMVAAFISVDVPNIRGFVLSLFKEDDQEKVGELFKQLNGGLSGVIRGQLVICLVNGVLTWVGLAILGVKYSFVLAVIAGSLSLIPVFGTIISTIPCVLIGLTQSFTTGLLVLAWILVIHFVEGNILNPKILGSSARIHPALVIFALLAGEHTFGIIGALIAVPIASIIQTLFIFFKSNAESLSQDEKLTAEGGEGL